jgi:ribosome recycling factor
MSLINDVNKNLENSNLNFIDKFVKENKINLLYQKYTSEENEKISKLLKKCEKEVGTLQISMSGCSNKELNEIYGFDEKKDYSEKFKNKGLDIISVILKQKN